MVAEPQLVRAGEAGWQLALFRKITALATRFSSHPHRNGF